MAVAVWLLQAVSGWSLVAKSAIESLGMQKEKKRRFMGAAVSLTPDGRKRMRG